MLPFSAVIVRNIILFLQPAYIISIILYQDVDVKAVLMQLCEAVKTFVGET